MDKWSPLMDGMEWNGRDGRKEEGKIWFHEDSAGGSIWEDKRQ